MALAWAAGTDLSWFGPFAFFLILPAILYAAFKAPRRLKAVAVALLGYCYLMILIPAWIPGNARLFTIFFATGGYFVAFLLPPWRLSRRQRSLLQIHYMCTEYHKVLTAAPPVFFAPPAQFKYVTQLSI